MKPTRTSRPPLPHEFPYFVIEIWGGRLETPPEYRGTPIAKQFESGRLGGRKVVFDERFADDEAGRADIVRIVREHRDADVFFVRSPRRSRQRLGTSVLFRPNFIGTGID